jgi:peptide/nickel transport system permease protein
MSPILLLRRITTAFFTLILASMMVFGALLVVPGDPVQLILGLNYNPEQYKVLEQQLGLDKPAPERYLNWITGALRGNLGKSTYYNASVSKLVLDTLPVTVPLVLLSTVLALAMALPLGILAARKQGTALDSGLVALSQLGLAIPSFWLGLLFILCFAVWLHWLPSGGFVPWSEDATRAARSMVLPTLTLALGQAAGLVRMVRSSVLEVQVLDYIRTARSKGLAESTVVRKHILKNALITIVTLVGLQIGQLLAGSIVVESVFNIRGLGSLGLQAVKSSDFPLVQGVVLVIATVIVSINFVLDLLYALIDPRIHYD